MKNLEKKRFRQSALINPLACIALTVSAISIVPMASATTKHSPGADIVWCNGDGTAYAPIPGFPGDTLPFGPSTVDPTFGLNPLDTWDEWEKNSELTNLPSFGEMLTTSAVVSEAALVNDVYAVQLNYWNSIVNANPAYGYENYWFPLIGDYQKALISEYKAPTDKPFGHSKGHSCLSFGEYGNNRNSGFAFVITYPASPSAPDQREIDFKVSNPDDYPEPGKPAPFVSGPTTGGPTGYVSAFKGCNWDGNSCTMGSNIPGKGETVTKSTDINHFPVKLSDITMIPTTWEIEEYPYFGKPIQIKDKTKQVWDAAYDIWFDKDAHTAEGKAPYTNTDARGQNDGLEIMVWMHSNGSYVDAGSPNNMPSENQPGLAQPTGHIRERVIINDVLYDVWVGRLNNPYFGYLNSTIIPPNEIPGNCPLSKGKGAMGELCGVEWNVVSFVASKDNNGTDYRKTSMNVDAKIFTNYLLGIQDGKWKVHSQVNGSPTRAANEVLKCPASNKNQDLTAATIDCLNPNWYLMSVQAGFEPWIGGNGLMSKRFTAYVISTPTAAQYGLTNNNGKAIISAKAPFNLTYPASGACKTYSVNNHVTFNITGTGPSGNVSYPANGTKLDMGAQNPKTLQFTANVASALSPMRGDAVVHFTSSCGNFDVPIYVDGTGKVSFSDGTTPVQDAKLTLQYSPSGNQNGPYIDVPNLSSVMKGTGNVRNPMVSSAAGTYGWNLVPGWYKVNANYKGTSVTSVAKQVTATQPLSLDITIPVSAPAPIAPAPGPVTKGVTVTLTPNGTDAAHSYCRNVVLKNTTAAPVTWTVQFDLPFAGNFINTWNFNYTKTGKTVTATGVGWNNELAAGKTSDSIGFCATK